MKVKIHTLFDRLLRSVVSAPEAVVGFSLSASPRLGDFLADLDPDLSLDWNGRDFMGLPELRDHILAQAGLTGVLARENVLVTAGAAEANYLALMQLLEPGDEIVVEAPGWPQAEVIAAARGAAIRRVHRDETAGWALPLDRLADAVTARTRLIFLTNPNNPTGHLLSGPELREIAGIAARAGAWLLVDEVYAGLEWDGPRAPSAAGLYERGITTGSVSKALGLQGLRTGWMITPDRSALRDAVILRENSSEIMNVLGETIAEIALRPDRLASALAKARAEGATNLAVMDAWVRRQPRLSWRTPRAGLIGLARLDGIDGTELADRLLDPPYRTFLMPGVAYGLPQHIRLGVGGGAGVNLGLGLERLSACLSHWK